MDFWTVEDGELARYIRHGECNQCGACCCTHTITLQMEVGAQNGKRDDESDDEKKEHDWSEREGWSMFLAQGIWWYFKITAIEPKENFCPALTPDRQCSEWQTDDFRPICRYWPFHPDNLAKFPTCGFSFERITND